MVEGTSGKGIDVGGLRTRPEEGGGGGGGGREDPDASRGERDA